MNTVSPRIDFTSPSQKNTRPCPPASTTPASLSVGSISGVFSRVSWASLRIFSTADTISKLSRLHSAAERAACRATVSIVPSTGFITALYAMDAATCSPRASPATSRVVLPSTPFANPLKSCESITPEFPLAPIREPNATASARSDSVLPWALLISRTAARSVRCMFVPVSPSGTGNTFNALTSSLFAPNHSVPATIARAKSSASSKLRPNGLTPCRRSLTLILSGMCHPHTLYCNIYS